MAKVKRTGKAKKKPIEQYDHKGKKRVNNPPVGLVTQIQQLILERGAHRWIGFGADYFSMLRIL